MGWRTDHRRGDPHKLWFTLVLVNKSFRFPLAVLFFLIFGSGEFLIEGPLEGTPLSAAKARGRSSMIAPAARSVGAYSRDAVRDPSLVNSSKGTEQKRIPCESLQITERGVVCDGYWLDFPEVIMGDALDGESPLPRQSGRLTSSGKVVRGALYQNLSLVLRWEPATPEFLQIHLKEYLPYWGGRIPYRLFWDAQYEVCSARCSTLHARGEILPSGIENLPPSLAADINFNGVPAAFWNENLKP